MMNDEGAVRKAKELAEGSTPILVGTPTIFELYVGVSLSSKAFEERGKILDVLVSVTQLPLDAASAVRGGIIYGQKVKEGRKIDPEDAMLAGIAIENNQPLLTRNKRDFIGIQGLKVETY